jgi:hypothetical protein
LGIYLWWCHALEAWRSGPTLGSVYGHWVYGGPSMTTLERCCSLLLLAYPAAYRRDRGEEIIGTLLEATAPGRSWPLARDVRALLVGGLRARAALNRQTTAANLRIAVLVGAAVYVAFSASTDLAFSLIVLRLGSRPDEVGWQLALVGVLGGLVVVAAWASSRRPILLAAAIATAVAGLLIGWWPSVFGWPLPELACLVVLALLAGREERPGRGWLWPVALVAVVPLMGDLLPGVWPISFLTVLGAIGVISLLWVVIDARPAVAASVFLVSVFLPMGLASFAFFNIGQALPLLIVIPLAAFAVWRLRRQSARFTARPGQ